MQNKFMLIGGLLILIIAAVFVYQYFRTEEYVACTMEAKICPDGSAVGRSGPRCEFAACPQVSIGIEEYIRANISTLSPEKEVLGGKFYVTRIEFENGVGVVEYEDGHIALVADFTYMADEAGMPKVTSFVVR